MRISRKILALGLIALAAAIVALVQSFNGLAARTHDQVHQELQKFLGKEITFDRLEASLLGGFGFSAKEFRIADDPRFAATPFVHARELKLKVSLFQLLVGRVVVDSMTLEDPEFQIITSGDGVTNISALSSRKKNFSAFPRERLAGPDKRASAVSFMISNITIRNGRVDFIDRSVKEPAEVQIKQVHMELSGLDSAHKTTIKFAAALTEGVGHDVRIEGQLGPLEENRAWSQQPVDLKMEFDSLYVPLLTRAMPFLRNKIPRELEVTGPSSLRANLRGTLERPRIDDLVLKAPLFGSSDYNATLTGTVALPANRSWDQAELKGKLSLEAINASEFRSLPFLRQTLPVGFTAEGRISIFSRFEGSWERLRIGVLIRAGRSQFRYGEWLHKGAGSLADLRGGISREQNGLRIHESVLTLGNSKMTISGAIEQTPEPYIRLKLRSDRSSLAAWGHLASPLSVYGVSGGVDWDMVVERSLSLTDGEWSIRGVLRLTDAELRQKKTGKTIERLNAKILFAGRKARAENLSFRLGSSLIRMTASTEDVSFPRASYELQSPELNLSDLPPFPATLENRLKNVTAIGEIQIQGGAPLLQGNLSSPEGSFHGTVYRNLKATVAWAPTGVSFRNLHLYLFNGTLQSDGFWVSNGEHSQRLEVTSQLNSVNLQALLTQRFPQLKNRLQGVLSFRGRFSASAKNGSPLLETLSGSGEVLIHQGTITDFNLLKRIFSRQENAATPLKTPFRLPAALVALADQPDTSFDVLRANLVIEQKGLRAEKIMLSTPAYTVAGAGWVGSDRTTKWNGTLVLSPQVSLELQREYKTIRYLLDARGRLSVPFRVDGKLPHVNIRPGNRALAQALGLGSSQGSADGEKGGSNRERREWLPDSLEKLLNR